MLSLLHNVFSYIIFFFFYLSHVSSIRMDSITSCFTSAYKCFLTAHVSPFMTLSEITFVPLFLWKAVALWNVLPMPFFLSLFCLTLTSTGFCSLCSRFICRRAWISTRWSGCCVRWRSFWKARRCGLQRASGSWSQSWRHFRTLCPRCPKRTSQLASAPLTYIFKSITLKWPTAKLSSDFGKNRFCYVQSLWLPVSCDKQRTVMFLSTVLMFIDVCQSSLSPIQLNCNCHSPFTLLHCSHNSEEWFKSFFAQQRNMKDWNGLVVL